MGTDVAFSLLFCAAKRSGAFPPNIPARLRARVSRPRSLAHAAQHCSFERGTLNDVLRKGSLEEGICGRTRPFGITIHALRFHGRHCLRHRSCRIAALFLLLGAAAAKKRLVLPRAPTAQLSTTTFPAVSCFLLVFYRNLMRTEER